MTLASVALLALVLSAVAARIATGPAVQVDHATTVRPGQSLSEVAAEQLPGVPLRESVPALQVANGMSTTAVAAGQALLVPRL